MRPVNERLPKLVSLGEAEGDRRSVGAGTRLSAPLIRGPRGFQHLGLQGGEWTVSAKDPEECTPDTLSRL